MTIFYLFRHGAIGRSEAERFIGQTDSPLGPEGRLQACCWRNKLQNVGFTAAWSSDLARAAATAAIIFGGRDLPVRTTRNLREIHLGEWEGLPRHQVKERHPDLWKDRGRDLADFRPTGGESFRDVQKRAVSEVMRISAEASGNVGIVTHAGVIRVLICHFLQVPLSNLFRIRIDYGSLSIVSCTLERVEVWALNHVPDENNHPTAGVIGGQRDFTQV
jgi:probable phosphoglycerate mutase